MKPIFLAGDYKRTVAINDNISFPYIVYQFMLMVGTVLGPGTIFLMLVGAMVASFRISNWDSFYYNIIPILFFMIICFSTKNDVQVRSSEHRATLPIKYNGIFTNSLHESSE